ncbi:MAG: zinc ribbon domain-containing protein [Edaphobacter sp.]|uniref:zinc ribbon domain-containing protein n=1 Tax=Edaphobacter sp. TaxID=1934404 RepID=UPI002398AFEF|nr:zinc ribbon domain-containing protein [Edaphobacter sp.]MDE1177674.1 zinc ribbon domain-containing protein [Edaphobacter sp.]
MATIEFVRNYTDHSTDRGYQFEFRCDHCYSGYMSSFDPSVIGAAGGLLQAAGSLFGGLLGSAGSTAYDIQRAIGGPAHDRALQQAVTEVKQKFRRCQRCGKWVCAEICWNDRAAQCTGCTPKYEQEVISMRTQAQIEATRDQLREKADQTDYVSEIDMNPDAQVRIQPGGQNPQLGAQAGGWQATLGAQQPALAEPAGWQTLPQSTSAAPQSAEWQTVHVTPPPVANVSASSHCTGCGATLTGGRFCANCGAPAAVPKRCAGCGHVSAPAAKFCEDCGTKLG